jgi:parallel beta-helix repeat protein
MIFIFCVTISVIGNLNLSIAMTANSNSYNNLYKIDQGSITINGNSELQQMALNEGWNGTGTENDPIRISNLEIFPSSGKGIEIISTTDYIVIENNFVSTNVGGAGIFLQYVSNLVLFNNTIFNSSIGGVYILSSSVNITSNVIDSNHGYGVYFWSGDNCVIKDNTFIGNQNSGLRLGNINNSIVSNNYFYDNVRRSIVVDNTVNSIISNNIVLETRRSDTGDIDATGIYIQNSQLIQIKDNIIANNFFEGIFVTGNSQNIIIDSNILADDDIHIVFDPIQITIRNNTLMKGGIVTSFNAGSHFIEFNIITSTSIGITLGSPFNQVRDNVILDSNIGVMVEGASNNAVYRNFFEQISDYELDIRYYQGSPEFNSFYANSFVDSNIQLLINNDNNNWDNITHGNYWGNYFGQDLNSDGIGDQIHLIGTIAGIPDQKIYDNYPLMNVTPIPDYSRITFAENILAFYSIGLSTDFPQSTQTSQLFNITQISSSESTSISFGGDFLIFFLLGIFVLGGLGVSVYVTRKNRIPEQNYPQTRVVSRQPQNTSFTNNKIEPISKSFRSQSLVTFCSNCGNKSEIGDVYCGNCGNRVIK